MSDPNEKLYQSAMDHVRANVDFVVGVYGRNTESPIELLLLRALMAYRLLEVHAWPQIEGMHIIPNHTYAWEIKPQAHIGNYRVDFLLIDNEMDVKVVIECDGHDFHERTKEQAMRDRRRDRELQAMGYLVLRFTGAEIYRDPWACADEIQKKIWAVEQGRPALQIVAPDNAAA